MMKKMTKVVSMLLCGCVVHTCLSGCNKDNEDSHPAMKIEAVSGLDSPQYFGDEIDFSVNLSSPSAAPKSLKAVLTLNNQELATKTMEVTQNGIYSDCIPLPYPVGAQEGDAFLMFTLTNESGGLMHKAFRIQLQYPEFESVELVLSGGERVAMTLSESCFYRYEGEIPVNAEGYVETPAFGAVAEGLTFGAKDDQIILGSKSNISLGNSSAGTYIVTFNIRTCELEVTESGVYMQRVIANRNNGMPPSNSPYYDVIVSRNKKAVNTAGRTGNRIADENKKEIYFPISSGSQIIDGYAGIPRGTITSTTGRVNIGSRRVINGKQCSFIFSVKTDKGSMSGWMYEENFAPSPLLTQYAADIALNLNPGPVAGDAPVKYQVIADPGEIWGNLKVRDNQSLNESVKVRDYTDRGDKTVYLLYALPFFGGYANDAVIADGNPIFIPDEGVPIMVLPVFKPVKKSGAPDPDPEELARYDRNPDLQVLEWQYGRIGDQRGWICRLNLWSEDGKTKICPITVDGEVY